MRDFQEVFSNYRRRGGGGGGGGADTRTKVVSARCDAISCECIFLARPYNNARVTYISFISTLLRLHHHLFLSRVFIIYSNLLPGYFQFSLTLAIFSFFLFVQFN